jgi:hypothetical protein
MFSAAPGGGIVAPQNFRDGVDRDERGAADGQQLDDGGGLADGKRQHVPSGDLEPAHEADAKFGGGELVDPDVGHGGIVSPPGLPGLHPR